jgi:hypothetical protein
MDQLAVVACVGEVESRELRVESQRSEAGSAAFLARGNIIAFAPDGARGVAAYVDGKKTATA